MLMQIEEFKPELGDRMLLWIDAPVPAFSRWCIGQWSGHCWNWDGVGGRIVFVAPLPGDPREILGLVMSGPPHAPACPA